LVVRAIAVACGACHENSGVTVSSPHIQRQLGIRRRAVESVLATNQSGWLPWSPKHHFDRAEFEADAGRLKTFYADRGYPRMRIAGVDVSLNSAKDGPGRAQCSLRSSFQNPIKRQASSAWGG
jgi:hypothetical protein